MQRIAKFEKVSFDQFEKDFTKLFGNETDVKSIYDEIKLPKRATTGSAGYDFFSPIDICLEKNKTILVPTGIRAKIDEGWVLDIFPRSGLGFKHRIQLDNTVGIIDSDYYYSSNEGHIMIKISCDAYDEGHMVEIIKGSGFAQGIFMPFGITVDDEVSEIRDGGFGSTTK
ncbi:MAG: deoxyuridine 5'-triphosphate nucleotidohydrolase [Ruminococcaceae bacterium]|nr:deoxyuridine 5'-triphosphate nucleotidohydrolase [Oscillospiraceae bacterium]